MPSAASAATLMMTESRPVRPPLPSLSGALSRFPADPMISATMNRLLPSAGLLATLLLTLAFVAAPAVQAQDAPAGEPIADEGPVVIDFAEFTGDGFAPDPAAGQLDSDVFAVEGLSDGDLAFGGTETGGDFARGESVGGVTTGGIYAGTPSDDNAPWLFVQPGGSDFTPGMLTVRYINTSGQTITDLDVTYDIKVFNDQARSNSWNFSYSTDDDVYTDVAALDYTSPGVADATPVWQSVGRNTSISGLSIPDGGNFYIRFSSDDVGGSGSRDEIGIDDLTLTATLEAAVASVRFGADMATITEGDEYSLLVELVGANSGEAARITISTTCMASDVTPVSDMLTLTAGSPSASITLTATEDMVEEPQEDCPYDLTVVPVIGMVNEGSPNTFILTIDDNDAPPLVNSTVIISEFMPDPDFFVDDSDGEWIELFNATPRPFNLDGHRIRDAGGATIALDGLTIPAQDFVVLCINSDVLANGGVSCDLDYANGFSLNNGGDDIILENSDFVIVDSIRYTSAWFSPGISAVYTGSPNGDNSVLGNWAESISREPGFDSSTAIGDDGSPGTNGVHGNLSSPFGVGITDYCYAVVSGLWSDAATWMNCSGGVPIDGDAAAILAGITVTVSEPTAVSVVVVEAGPPGGPLQPGSEAGRGGSSDGLLLIDSRLDASVVSVAGSAIVSATGALNISTDLSVLGSLTTNDAVTLLATANGPAHYTDEIFGSVNGTLTAERRYVDDPTEGGGSFRGIFPPLAGVTFDQLNDDFQTQGAIGSNFPDAVPNLYRFNAPTQQFFPITDFTGEFDPDSGYVFYMFDFDVPGTWDVTGTLPEENTIDLFFSDDGEVNDYNWVPQPFPGPIDFRELYRNSTFTPDSLNATFYVLDPATEEFRIYNAITQIGADPMGPGAGRYGAPFQSFVVRPNALNTTLDYTYDIMDTGESPLLVGRSALVAVQDDVERGGAVQADEVAPHVRLELEGVGEAVGLGSRQAYLAFHEQGAEGYDAGDAGLLYPFSADYAALVLIDEAGQELAMDARGLDISTETFRARVATTQPGTYTLSWPTFHEIPSGWEFVLVDTETGAEVDLREQSAYTFEVGGPTAARRDLVLGKLRPDQFETSERFVITVRALATAGEDAGTAPGVFALEDAYPNPFTTTATIPYVLPQAADVRLTVYDVLGREVATLAEGAHEAGRHAATVSGRGLSGGVYFVRMTADGFAATKKVVVLN